MSLLTSLIAHWKLNEASGTRNDSHSTNHLTDNNTVTSNPGKLDSAGQFTAASSEYLSLADNAALSSGNIDFTIAAWVYLDTKPSVGKIVAKDNAASGGREYVLDYVGGGTDRFRFFTGRSGSSSIDAINATTFGAPSTGTWYFVVAWHDSAGGTVNISVNNGAANSAARTGGPPDSSTAFEIGRGGGGSHWNGRIDSVSFWKRLLTSDEITALYNSGNGLDYESFAGGTDATVSASGSQCLAENGSCTVTGAATGSPSGSECAGESGTVTVTAGATVLPAGAEGLCGSGNAAASGAAAVTISGSQVLGESGTVTASGDSTPVNVTVSGCKCLADSGSVTVMARRGEMSTRNLDFRFGGRRTGGGILAGRFDVGSLLDATQG